MSIVNSNQWGQIKEEINNNALPRSGGQMTGDIDMGGNNITGLGNAVNDNDALNKGSLKSLRPFAMQIISITLDFSLSPTGATEQLVYLNPEFEQKFSTFAFIRFYYRSGTNNFLIGRGCVNNTITLESGGSFQSVGVAITHIEEESAFKFSVSEQYSNYGTRSFSFLVIGIN